MKRCLSLLVLLTSALGLSLRAQRPEAPRAAAPFGHLDVTLSAGSDGLGLDVATPVVGDLVAVRLGYAFMPSFKARMRFGVQVGDSTVRVPGEDGRLVDERFEYMAKMLEDFTGYRVDDRIDMIGRPAMHNFRVLADVTPFRNKAWRLTAGFYVGPRRIARALNAMEDMPSLVAVGIYNNLYDKAMAWEPVTLGGIVSIDPDLLHDKLEGYGRMNIHVGDFVRDMTDRNGTEHKKGEPYRMVPDAESTVRATMKVNAFRPYLGFGYGGRLVRGDDRYWISFDCGALFWGGTPHVLTHDGVDLTHDVENVSGSVGRYVDAVKGFKVFPVLDLRLTRRFAL